MFSPLVKQHNKLLKSRFKTKLIIFNNDLASSTDNILK